jgi:D-aminoacyl-tRNA deacylase
MIASVSGVSKVLGELNVGAPAWQAREVSEIFLHAERADFVILFKSMRAVIQRVKCASVVVEGEVVGSIAAGLLVLLGVQGDDSADDIAWLAQKLAGLRLFADSEGPWCRSVEEICGGVLVVSQFTLLASTKKGTKPSWHRAAKPEIAAPLCEQFVSALERLLPGKVQCGRFGAMMDVSLVNDGPVTLIIDTKSKE